MEDFRVALIQSDIFWEDSARNISRFGMLIDSLPGKADLLALPEMFNTGFSINPSKCAEKAGGSTMQFMKEKAVAGNMMIAGSILTEDEGAYYNRVICMSPDGTFSQYDKRHLFRLSEEYLVMSSGREKVIVNLKGWNILPLVCYDLRFPVWSRNTWKDGMFGYDILLYVANWPKSRSHIWHSLLIARAIENQCYVIGVNRTGRDGQGTMHCGRSMIVGPDGTTLASASAEHPEVLQYTLSMEKLTEFRRKYPFAPDWDQFTIQT